MRRSDTSTFLSTTTSYTGLDKLGDATPPRGSRSRLGHSVADWLATPASVRYRLAYQRHRLGGAAGAVGDEPAAEATADSCLLEEALGGQGGVFGPSEMYETEKGFHALLKWRLSYQAHRSGASRGAKGEIGAGLSAADVRMLPVARMSAHRRELSALRRPLPRVSEEEAISATGAESLRPTHVHVGAGRLGLGLLVPALARTSKASGGTLVILQRPSEAWEELAHDSVARFTVNQQPVCSLRVVRGASTDALRAGAEGAEDGLLVLSEEPAVLDVLAHRATSLSCSLGPALSSGLAPLLAALTRADAEGGGRGGRLRLYAAENDHAAVSKLAATPAEQGGLAGMPIKMIPLLVDRVCTARTITPGQVDTSAEPWAGEIVAMTPPADADDEDADGLLAAPPFCGEGVRWPQSEAEAHFLHRRKILTVNGTHTTLAFHTLAVHEPPPHTGLPRGEYELLRAVADDAAAAADDDDDAAQDAALQVDETHRMAWTWAVARQLLLLFDSDYEVALAALGCERDDATEAERALVDALLAGARVAIGRLGKGGDTTKRVLGGGVVNRYQTRLKPVASFLDSTGAGDSSRWLRGRLPRLLLRRAKLTEATMRLAVLGLAADAERFTVDTKAAEVATPSSKPSSAKPSPAQATAPTPKKATDASPAAKLPASVAAA